MQIFQILDIHFGILITDVAYTACHVRFVDSREFASRAYLIPKNYECSPLH